MANEEHLAILKQGVEAWNEWREANSDIRPELTDADLSGANLIRANLSHTNLRDANLSDAQLILADLSDSKVIGANLRRANLNDAKLIRARLSETKLSQANLSEANLFRADLTGADLSRADLGWANLSESDLSGAKLIDATLLRAYFGDANLSGADLNRANLSGTKLQGVDLSGANLSRANLSHADLSRVTFERTRLMETVFGSTNLSAAKGLEGCYFAAPCIVDHRTIERSAPLPLAFLRGCGLPDAVIDSFSSLRDQQYYSCFISYSSKDDEFAQHLHADLQNNGVRCWFAPHDIAGGKKIHEQIQEAIGRYERLLLILSEHSMESDWVATEIANAREREVSEKRQVLFPIRLVDYERIKAWKCFDADRRKDSAREIREYFIPNFTNWKDHDAYTESFERLLKDLKAESTVSKSE